MKVKILLILVLSVTTLTAFAQDGGVRGRVVSRAGRVALDGVKVTMTPGDVTVMSDERGNFLIENVPAGEYSLPLVTPPNLTSAGITLGASPPWMLPRENTAISIGSTRRATICCIITIIWAAASTGSVVFCG